MKWLLIAVLATHGIDAKLSPLQESYATKEECTQARIILQQLATEAKLAVLSACVEVKPKVKPESPQ